VALDFSTAHGHSARLSLDHPLMRTLHCLRLALAHAALLASATAAVSAQEPQGKLTGYSSTLTFGTGLINTPVAWVSPEHGDLFLAASARGLDKGTLTPHANGSMWDMTMAVDAHLFGRVSLGGSLYGTSHQQVGMHAALLLYRQQADLKWLPSLAVGVRNVGSSARQDRYVTGFKRVVDVLPASERATKGVIDGSPTLYGVMTREFSGEETSFGLSAGYGTGLFKNDGGLDTVYNKKGTLASGLFLGTRLAHRFSPKTTGTLMVENDGWDWNAGITMSFGHVIFGVMATELEEAGSIPKNEPLANWRKANLMIAYNGSIPDIVRGSRQRSEAVELELERLRLKREVNQRERRVAELADQLARAATRADAESMAQRAALEKALESEREAAKRAADRLKQVTPGTKPPEEK
jgi:hypothetical protein